MSHLPPSPESTPLRVVSVFSAHSCDRPMSGGGVGHESHRSGLRVITDAEPGARRSSRRLVLAPEPARVDRLLKLVGIADRLEIVDLPANASAARESAVFDPPDAA